MMERAIEGRMSTLLSLVDDLRCGERTSTINRRKGLNDSRTR